MCKKIFQFPLATGDVSTNRQSGFLQRKNKFKLQITLDRHNDRQNLNYCVFPTPFIFRYHLPLNVYKCGLRLDKIRAFLLVDNTVHEQTEENYK
jgi:hypothetical protein